MDIKLELGGSQLDVTDDGLTVHIARYHFTPRQWQRIVSRLSRVKVELGWLAQPFRTVGTTGARWKKQSLDWFSLIVYLLLLPREHKLVGLLPVIDWGEIDRRCAAAYQNGCQGSRAYAPQVLYRLLLIAALYGLRFESSLVRQVETNLAWRWFCGFGLLTPLPRAATLCIFRQRLGAEKFEEILGWLIGQCQQAGLIGFEEAFFDFTGVAANADQLTPYERAVVLAKALSAYLAGLNQGDIHSQASLAAILPSLVVEAAQTVLSQDYPSLAKGKPEQLLKSQQRLDQELAQMSRGARWWAHICQFLSRWRQQAAEIVAEGECLLNQVATTAAAGQPIQSEQLAALKTHLQRVGQALKPAIPHAWGDLSARVGKLSRGQYICGYLAGYLVDGAHNIIIGLVSVAANVRQSEHVMGVLQQSKRLLGRLPRRLGLDSAFDYDHLYTDLEQKAIEFFISPRYRHGPKGRFNSSHFYFNQEEQLCCPNDQPMICKYGPYESGQAIFMGVGCQQCSLADQCLPKGQHQRRLNIHPESHRRWQNNRTRSQSQQGQEMRRQRFARESLFGHGNTYHNGDRNPYRLPGMNRVADSLTVFALNLEKLAAKPPPARTARRSEPAIIQAVFSR